MRQLRYVKKISRNKQNLNIFRSDLWRSKSPKICRNLFHLGKKIPLWDYLIFLKILFLAIRPNLIMPFNVNRIRKVFFQLRNQQAFPWDNCFDLKRKQSQIPRERKRSQPFSIKKRYGIFPRLKKWWGRIIALKKYFLT